MRKTDRIVIRMGAARNDLETEAGVIPFNSTIPDPYHRAKPGGGEPQAYHVAAALLDALGMPKVKPAKSKRKPPKQHKERRDATARTKDRSAAEPGQTRDGPKRPRRRRRTRSPVPVAGPGQP